MTEKPTREPSARPASGMAWSAVEVLRNGAYPARERYTGAVARGYVRKRAGGAKWRREQRIVESLVGRLPAGSRVLDAPLGTGRFLQAYANRGHVVLGVDISWDMLGQAQGGSSVRRTSEALVQAEIEALPARDQSVDYVVCTRFMNWVPPAVFPHILGEFRRVAREEIILEMRVAQRLSVRELARRIVVRRLWTDPRRVLRRLKRMAPVSFLFGSRPRSAGYTVHRADTVTRAFETHGLVTIAVHTVGERLEYLRREAHLLRIYVLRRKAG